MSNAYSDHEHDVTMATRDRAWRDAAGRLPEDDLSPVVDWCYDRAAGDGSCPYCASGFVSLTGPLEERRLRCDDCGHQSETLALRRRPPRRAGPRMRARAPSARGAGRR